MRGKWLLFAGVVILAGIGAGALSLLFRSGRPGNAGPAPGVSPPIGPEVACTGRIQARRVVAVPAPMDGVLEEVLADVGQDVFEGQLLARIKNSALESALDRAQLEFERAQTRVSNLEGALIAARLEAARAGAEATRSRQEFEKAEKTYLRQQLLHKEGATPRLVFERAQKDYLAAKAEYESLAELAARSEERVRMMVSEIDAARRTLEERTADVEQAKEDLLATEVHSPLDGILVARRGEAGSEVNRSMQDLFQIAVELASLEVILEPEPPVLARILPGQAATVRVAETGNEPLQGSVREVKGAQVFVEFTSPSPAIRPGLTAQVTIRIG